MHILVAGYIDGGSKQIFRMAHFVFSQIKAYDKAAKTKPKSIIGLAWTHDGIGSFLRRKIISLF
jgi:hypothetical protein